MKFCKFHPAISTHWTLDICRSCYDRERKWRFRGISITTEEYFRRLGEQEGSCFFCDRPPKPSRFLDVDHDHITDKIRGLLCNEHNRALGVVEKNRALIEQMLAYLAASR